MNRYATITDAETFKPLLEPNGKEIIPDFHYIVDSKHATTEKMYLMTRASYPTVPLSKLQEGATIWFLASALKDFETLHVSNETIAQTWHIKNIKYDIIPDAQLQLRRGASSHTQIPFKFHGVSYIMDILSKQYPGYEGEIKGWLRDRFPINVDCDGYMDDKGHGFASSVPHGGKAYSRGFCGGGGSMTARRSEGEGLHKVVEYTILDEYNHDTNAETAYVGYTKVPPHANFINLVIDRYLSVRPGSETQLQHIIGGAKIGKLFTFNSGVRFPYSFQRWQDAGYQIVVDAGVNHFESLFIDGFGSNALACYSAPKYDPLPGVQPGDEVTFDRVYIRDGHLAIYVHASCKEGMVWRIKELYVSEMTNYYSEVTGEPKVDYYLNHAGTDKFIIEKLYHDGSRPKIAKDLSKFQIGEVILLQDFPKPKYKYPQYKAICWSEFVANYHPCPDGTPMKYKAGQFVLDWEHGKPFAWFRSKTDHVATPLRPKNDPVNFEPIVFDSENRIANHIGETRLYPTDNFTQTYDSPTKQFTWMVEPEPIADVMTDSLMYVDWKRIDLTKFKEAMAWGPLKANGRPLLRGSVGGDNPGMISLSPDQWLRLRIAYIDGDPTPDYRIEFTEDPWRFRLPEGTEDRYAFNLRFSHRASKVFTPISILQMYSKSLDTQPEDQKVSEVMFQLELSYPGQKDMTGYAPPSGTVMVVHNAAKAGKYRRATKFRPEAGAILSIELRVKHGLQGYIRLVINGEVVYEVWDRTAFPEDPTATAQMKWGVYHYGLINNPANVKKYLNAGVTDFTMDMSNVMITRILPSGNNVPEWYESFADPRNLLVK